MERGLEGEEERKAISVFPPDHLKQIKELTETAETYLVSALFFIPRKRPREKGRGIEKERGTVSWPKWRGRWNLTEEKIYFLGWDLGVIGKQREGGERGGVSNTHRQYRPVNIHLLDHNNKMQREREREAEREHLQWQQFAATRYHSFSNRVSSDRNSLQCDVQMSNDEIQQLPMGVRTVIHRLIEMDTEIELEQLLETNSTATWQVPTIKLMLLWTGL